MELQIVSVILGFGAVFALGMYVAFQVDRARKEAKRKDDLKSAVNNYYGVTEEDEKRMDIIGQNGNDGLHYDHIDEPKDQYNGKTRSGGLSPDTGPRN
jgi:hypothetical protein